MKTVAIIGAQWGDEGKGKITDLLAAQADYVVRYQGGNNAGHTIIVEDKKIVLHLVPSGILHETSVSVISQGVVVEPEALIKEINMVREAGVSVTADRLKISTNANVITTYGRILDAQREAKGPVKIGTTGKGIGPTYEDKTARKGIKMRDLLDLESLKVKLEANLREKQVLFDNLYHCEYPSLEEEATRLHNLGKELAPYYADTFMLIDEAIAANKNILFEGAQGILLDIDYGTYPFVTSSNTTYGGLYTGTGLPGKNVDEVIGIAKAYVTRVGEGPFPTLLEDESGDILGTVGHEFGATTGRKRACGWLDLPLLKYAVKCSNLTSIALTKLDVLKALKELKVCVAYEYEGKQIDCAYPGIDLYKVKPVLKDMKLFNDDFTSEDLSVELKDYIKLIEDFIGIPVSILAYGPERSQIQFVKQIF